MIEARKEYDDRKPIENKLNKELLLILYLLPQYLSDVLLEISNAEENGIYRTPQSYKNQIERITDSYVEQHRDKWRFAFSQAIQSTIDLAKTELKEAGYDNATVPLTTSSNYVEAGASSLNKVISDIALGYGFLVDAIMVWNWVAPLVNQEVERIKDKLDRQVKFISTNTVLEVYTNSLQTMCESLGIDGYTWQTMEDDKVRPTHAENNGKYFTWKKPSPITGKPGDQPNCRCLCKIKKKGGQ